MNDLARALAALFLLLLVPVACAPPASAPPPRSAGLVREGTPDAVNVALARASGRARAFEWSELGPSVFERARREGKLVLLDGAAEWCHWCHVMDATTYTDPEVGQLLRDHFLAVRVDIDARPDIAERYGDWGWPATILFSASAEELGKYRGYLPPEELRGILRALVAQPESGPSTPANPLADRPPPIEAMPWIAGRALVDFDAYYDPKEGSWGRLQKAPIGENARYEVLRASRGDAAALERVRFTLSKHRLLIDPVWGGIYQYSVGRKWTEPHYEKLMTYQADNLEAFARAYALTKDEALRRDAEALARYMSTFLTNQQGAFLPSQDADVGAHDPGARFVDGHVYYALGDAERRALGVPRVDPHVHPFENGLAIAAFVTLHEATGAPDVLARARRAADVVLEAFVGAGGEVKREGRHPVRYLADAASFGRALLRLHGATGEPRYRDAAQRVATALLRDFDDPKTGACLDTTQDPSASGVFARRLVSLPNNVLAARFLLSLAQVTGDPSHRERARRALVAVSTPRALDARGRMLGAYLLALDEAGFGA